MTNTPTDEHDTETTAEAEAATPVVAQSAPVVTAEPEPVPFWQRRYVERYLVPLLMPIAVVIGLVAYILNISRLFLAGHGHISIFVGSAILILILVGAAFLSAESGRLNRSAITLVGGAFILAIMSGGWLVLGHSQPEATGPTSLPSTLKTVQPDIKVTAAIGGKLAFTPDVLKAKTGLVKIDVSVAGAGHTFNFHDPTTLWTSLALNTAGTTDSGIAYFAKAGSYAFFCAIPGHEAAGMKGTITVTGPPMTLAEAVAAGKNPPLAG